MRQVLSVFVLLVGMSPIAMAEPSDPDTWHPTWSYFLEHVARCEPAGYTSDAAGAVGHYEVIGRADAGCRLGFTYRHNPNSNLVDKRLTFVIDPSDELESAIREALAGCLSGADGSHDCAGPLFQSLRGASALEERKEAFAAPIPCGRRVEANAEPLFPMPRDGKWGFVDRAGEWIIAPRWDQVDEFSEGRAAVGSWSGWGIIDRGGDHVVEPAFAGASYTMVDGVKVVSSPFAGYSEGCAAAHPFLTKEEAAFVDRQGRFHWLSHLPDELADRDIVAYGGFSEGLAWFAEADGLERRYGWIDRHGRIIIESRYSDAGAFSGGLAPAAIKDGFAGFIDRSGELVLPGKWTLYRARAFSENLALVNLDAFRLAYVTPEDTAFDKVRFVHAHTEDSDEARIRAGGRFNDGLAPVLVRAASGGSDLLLYVRRDGTVASVPDELPELHVCNASSLPEYRHGLVRLLIADDGQDCGHGPFHLGLPRYDDAHYVYLDPDAEVVLRQTKGGRSTERAQQ